LPESFVVLNSATGGGGAAQPASASRAIPIKTTARCLCQRCGRFSIGIPVGDAGIIACTVPFRRISG